MDLPGKDIGCHHTGFEKKCRELVCNGVCNRWIQVSGKNPNTGEDVNHYDCVDNWMPMLTIQTAQQMRQAGAAIESFRNEMVNANQAANILKLAEIELTNQRYKALGTGNDQGE